ncbi:hypothetical protein HK102_008421, partial [Quaeritorhiza haematococci]
MATTMYKRAVTYRPPIMSGGPVRKKDATELTMTSRGGGGVILTGDSLGVGAASGSKEKWQRKIHYIPPRVRSGGSSDQLGFEMVPASSAMTLNASSTVLESASLKGGGGGGGLRRGRKGGSSLPCLFLSDNPSPTSAVERLSTTSSTGSEKIKTTHSLKRRVSTRVRKLLGVSTPASKSDMSGMSIAEEPGDPNTTATELLETQQLPRTRSQSAALQETRFSTTSVASGRSVASACTYHHQPVGLSSGFLLIGRISHGAAVFGKVGGSKVKQLWEKGTKRSRSRSDEPNPFIRSLEERIARGDIEDSVHCQSRGGYDCQTQLALLMNRQRQQRQWFEVDLGPQIVPTEWMEPVIIAVKMLPDRKGDSSEDLDDVDVASPDLLKKRPTDVSESVRESQTTLRGSLTSPRSSYPQSPLSVSSSNVDTDGQCDHDPSRRLSATSVSTVNGGNNSDGLKVGVDFTKLYGSVLKDFSEVAVEYVTPPPLPPENIQHDKTNNLDEHLPPPDQPQEEEPPGPLTIASPSELHEQALLYERRNRIASSSKNSCSSAAEQLVEMAVEEKLRKTKVVEETDTNAAAETKGSYWWSWFRRKKTPSSQGKTTAVTGASKRKGSRPKIAHNTLPPVPPSPPPKPRKSPDSKHPGLEEFSSTSLPLASDPAAVPPEHHDQPRRNSKVLRNSHAQDAPNPTRRHSGQLKEW